MIELSEINQSMRGILNLKEIIKKFVLYILEGLSIFFDNNKLIDPVKIKKILAYGGGSGIGDLLLALPAIESLHANFPKATISLLASPESKKVLSISPFRATISEIIDYDSKKKHKSFFSKLILLSTLRKKLYDLVYFPSRGDGMREEVLMNLLIGAPHRLGFKKGKVGLFNTVKIEFREDIPILKQNLAILEAANLDIYSEKIKLDVPKKDINAAKKLLSEHNFNNSFPLISIHPGASWHTKYKCWPIEKYTLLIRYLLKEFSAEIIIIGSKSEIDIGKRIFEKIQNPSLINMIGKTPITQMAAFIKLSHLFIGNDSGPLHVALSLGVPSIAIFGPTSPKQVISSTEKCIIISKEISCSPCYLHQPGFKPYCDDIKCLTEITVEEVIKYVRKMLSKIKNHPHHD